MQVCSAERAEGSRMALSRALSHKDPVAPRAFSVYAALRFPTLRQLPVGLNSHLYDALHPTEPRSTTLADVAPGPSRRIDEAAMTSNDAHAADLATRLASFLAHATGRPAAISSMGPIAGGASRETWAVDAEI